jgi:arsenate reductase-like glutaredoxin family protein
MNVVQIDPITKEVHAIMHDVQVLPEVSDKLKISAKSFPEIINKVGKRVQFFYDEVSDTFTHTLIDRPLTQEESTQLILSNQELLKTAMADLILGGM